MIVECATPDCHVRVLGSGHCVDCERKAQSRLEQVSRTSRRDGRGLSLTAGQEAVAR